MVGYFVLENEDPITEDFAMHFGTIFADGKMGC